MIYAYSLAFAVCAEDKNGKEKNSVINSDTFGGLIRDILKFYETGKPSFDRGQTINVMKLREGALKSLETPETWIKI